MKFVIFLMGIFACFAGEYNYAPNVLNPKEEKKLVVCIPSYNNRKYYKNNLDSVFFQNYQNYRVIYVNDGSKDGTFDLVKQYIEERNLESKITLIDNPVNMGATYNWYHMVHSCANDEIIVSLDGDDYFANKNVLARINRAYQDENVWITYGQWKRLPNHIGQSKAVKFKDLDGGIHRKIPFQWSQIRTFYAGLFKKIPIDSFQTEEGEFYPTACDVAIMLNLIDMAPRHIFFIPDILYIYNLDTQINDHKRFPGLQKEIELTIQARPPAPIVSDWK
jgi:glycosyltransferase involved in cell wall biosynthesis